MSDKYVLRSADGKPDQIVTPPREPRTWEFPPAPANRKVKVKDRDGVVWSRPRDDPGWVDLWHSPGMVPMRWHRLLGERGPLTEVER